MPYAYSGLYEDYVAGMLAMSEVFRSHIAPALHTLLLKTYQQLHKAGSHETVRSIVKAYSVY